ncbi:hypothetical protein [Rhizobium laguerreae]|uniref:hypothetical protein n=1 Tax=Rhizobium laguerreae TaxID=1076926 RepID=UPI001FEEF669|nr:hypothetical protein [Rhizobium laguerreae]
MTPLALMRTRTWPAPGTGFAISATRNGEFGASASSAFIVDCTDIELSFVCIVASVARRSKLFWKKMVH